jgi:hypothetical protein
MAELQYVVADESRFRYLVQERGRVDRWVPDLARATRFTEREAQLVRDTTAGAYISVPLPKEVDRG